MIKAVNPQKSKCESKKELVALGFYLIEAWKRLHVDKEHTTVWFANASDPLKWKRLYTCKLLSVFWTNGEKMVWGKIEAMKRSAC